MDTGKLKRRSSECDTSNSKMMKLTSTSSTQKTLKGGDLDFEVRIISKIRACK